jgi:nickel superoxide dismutase
MKKNFGFLLFFTILVFSGHIVFPHCEIPCGIYNDAMRFTLIAEHIKTIEKAMKQITELSTQSPQNFNQIVRWVVNKEKHAEEIQHIISQYFMTQRLKSVDTMNSEAFKVYIEKLRLCHFILVDTMKCKQTTDLARVEQLKSHVELFIKAYFERQEKSHKP